MARNAKLVEQNYQLDIANSELRQANVQLSGKKEAVPEHVTGATSTA